MRNVLTIILLLVLMQFSFSQETKSDTPFYPKSKKALSFSFNGLNLGEFYGGVGGKLWLSNSFALFASLDMDYSSNTIKESEQSNGTKTSLFSSGLTVGTNLYLSQNKRFLPYLGFNIGFGLSSTTTETDFINTDAKNIFETGLVNFGLGAALGVESFITESVSLSAQHALGLSLGSGSRKTTLKRPNQLDQVDENDESQFDFGLGTSSLILSIYF